MLSFQYIQNDLHGVKVKGWRQKGVIMKATLSEDFTAKEKAGNYSSHL